MKRWQLEMRMTLSFKGKRLMMASEMSKTRYMRISMKKRNLRSELTSTLCLYMASTLKTTRNSWRLAETFKKLKKFYSVITTLLKIKNLKRSSKSRRRSGFFWWKKRWGTKGICRCSSKLFSFSSCRSPSFLWFKWCSSLFNSSRT